MREACEATSCMHETSQSKARDASSHPSTAGALSACVSSRESDASAAGGSRGVETGVAPVGEPVDRSVRQGRAQPQRTQSMTEESETLPTMEGDAGLEMSITARESEY